MKAIFFCLALFAVYTLAQVPIPKFDDLCKCDGDMCDCCVPIAISKVCTEFGIIRSGENIDGIWFNVTYAGRSILKRDLKFKKPLEGDHFEFCKSNRWLKTEICLFGDNVEASPTGLCGCFRASLSSPIINTQKNFGLVNFGKVENCPTECA